MAADRQCARNFFMNAVVLIRPRSYGDRLWLRSRSDGHQAELDVTKKMLDTAWKCRGRNLTAFALSLFLQLQFHALAWDCSEKVSLRRIAKSIVVWWVRSWPVKAGVTGFDSCTVHYHVCINWPTTALSCMLLYLHDGSYMFRQNNAILREQLGSFLSYFNVNMVGSKS
jgi:hypothetical protein